MPGKKRTAGSTRVSLKSLSKLSSAKQLKHIQGKDSLSTALKNKVLSRSVGLWQKKRRFFLPTKEANFVRILQEERNDTIQGKELPKLTFDPKRKLFLKREYGSAVSFPVVFVRTMPELYSVIGKNHFVRELLSKDKKHRFFQDKCEYFPTSSRLGKKVSEPLWIVFIGSKVSEQEMRQMAREMVDDKAYSKKIEYLHALFAEKSD